MRLGPFAAELLPTLLLLLPTAAALLEAVVGAGRVLHVHITRDRVKQREQRK